MGPFRLLRPGGLGDKTDVWGVGYRFDEGASSADAEATALENCAKFTTGADIVVCLSSDGQHLRRPPEEPNTANSSSEAMDHMNTANAWNNQGQYDQALAEYAEAMRLLDPKDANGLAFVLFNRAVCWTHKGDQAKAVTDLTQCVTLLPKYASAYAARGRLWRDQGQYQKAVADYNAALAINPDESLACYDRGNAWRQIRNDDKAIADYTRAVIINPKYASPIAIGATFGTPGGSTTRRSPTTIRPWCSTPTMRWSTTIGRRFKDPGRLWPGDRRLQPGRGADPRYANAYNNLAWLLATCADEKYRDPKKAFAVASTLYQLDGGKHWNYLRTLAAAYAAAGDFDKAKEWIGKAIDLAAADKAATAGDKARCPRTKPSISRGSPTAKRPRRSKARSTGRSTGVATDQLAVGT